MNIFRHRKVTKKYAAKAAMYRRLAMKMSPGTHSFDVGALVEMFEYESIGNNALLFSQLKQRNGYALGKWLRDLDVSQMQEDITNGDFCKAEFLSTALERLHNKKQLASMISPVWFPWRELDINLKESRK